MSEQDAVRSLRDGLSRSASSPQAVSPVPASIPSADDDIEAAVLWALEQAEGIMSTTAGAATCDGDPTGVLQYVNSMASDIAINLEMAAQAIEARRAETLGSVHESAVPQGCAQGDAS